MHILLLTDIPPCTNYTAGLVQKQLCDFLFEEGHQVSCVSIVDPVLSPNIPEDTQKGLEAHYQFKKPKEGYGREKLGKFASLVFNNYNRKIYLSNLARRIKDVLATEEMIDVIWSVIQGQTMICLVPLVAKQLKLDYVVQIWDPPEWWLNENGFDKYSYGKVMGHFHTLLKNSKCCLAASFSMATEYSKVYGVKCIPVIPSLESGMVDKACMDKNEIHIGYSGQIYSKREFNVFVEALESMNWQYDNKNIIIDLFTDYLDKKILDKYPNIHNHGWIKQNDLLKKLSGMDFTYCPYRFDREFEIIARLSFPSKLTTYLKVASPVLIHAPKYSSISNFIDDGKTGYICNSLSVDLMKNKIGEILSDVNREKIGIGGYNLFLEYLTLETMKKCFLESLGIDKQDEDFTS